MEQTEIETPSSKRGSGRKSQDGSSEGIKFEPIKKACAEMMKSYKKAQEAKEAFNATVKAVAERSNCNASTLKKLVRSSAAGNFADTRNKIDQESVIFESVGEIAGGSISGEV